MQIRKFQEKDARKCSILLRKCILAKLKNEDSPKTVKNLIKGNTPKNLIKKSKERFYYVAVDGDKILGIGGFDKEGDLHTFFTDINYHGKGIGRKIMERVLKDAKKKGLKKLHSNSSLYAEKFYKKFGFKKIKKTTVPWKGNKITFIEMSKKLT